MSYVDVALCAWALLLQELRPSIHGFSFDFGLSCFFAVTFWRDEILDQDAQINDCHEMTNNFGSVSCRHLFDYHEVLVEYDSDIKYHWRTEDAIYQLLRKTLHSLKNHIKVVISLTRGRDSERKDLPGLFSCSRLKIEISHP